MPLAPQRALPRRRPRANADGRPPVRAARLTLDQAHRDAGDTVSGRVAGLDDAATVAVLRVERLPGAERVYEVAAARVPPPGGVFTVALPDEMLPSAVGERCGLRYVVCARGAGAAASAELVVMATACPHVDAGSARADRLLAGWEARHFHIELSEAQLEGGGALTGRVHRHGRWPPGEIVVTARCGECWRESALAGHGLSLWPTSCLWEQQSRLRPNPHATWAAFAFALPPGLPPAVEASSVAWRYEVIARRAGRWFPESAAVTPLLHESGSCNLAGEVRIARGQRTRFRVSTAFSRLPRRSKLTAMGLGRWCGSVRTRGAARAGGRSR